jgi:hypothetical protein
MFGGLRCCVLDDKLIGINEFNNLIYIITLSLRGAFGITISQE